MTLSPPPHGLEKSSGRTKSSWVATTGGGNPQDRRGLWSHTRLPVLEDGCTLFWLIGLPAHCKSASQWAWFRSTRWVLHNIDCLRSGYTICYLRLLFCFLSIGPFQSKKCALGAGKGQYGHALFLVHLAIMHRDVEVALSQHLHDSMAEDVFRTHVAGASNVISVIEAGNHINTFLTTGDKRPVSLLIRTSFIDIAKTMSLFFPKSASLGIPGS